MKQKILNLTLLLFCMIVGMGSAWGETKTVTISFGTSFTRIDSKDVSFVDELGSTWTVTTVGTSSFTANPSYYQVGSSSKPATSITFKCTLPSNVEVTSFKAKFGGFNGTAGNISLQVGETTVGTGKLNADASVEVSSSSSVTGNELTITVNSISKGVKVYNITYAYKTEEGSVTPTLQDATWDISPITVKADETTTASIITNYDGNLYVSSNDKGIATATITGKTLSVSGISGGKTTLTITGDATSTYNAINKTIDVTVTAAQGGGDDGEETHTIVASAEEWAKDDTQNKLTTIQNNYYVICSKENGSTSPAYVGTGNDVRVYANGTITISSENNEFDNVIFNISEQGLKRLAPITADYGVVSEQKSGDKTVTWTSGKPVKSVTFTVGEKANFGSDGETKAGQLDFTSIDIALVSSTEPDTPSTPTNSITFKATNGKNIYWATFSSTDNIVLPNEMIFDKSEGDFAEISVYAITSAYDEILELTPIDLHFEGEGTGWYLPANYGYLLKSERSVEGEHSYSYTIGDVDTFNGLTEYSEVLPKNMLVPSSVSMAGDKLFYKLTTQGGENLGFYWGAENGAPFTMNNPNLAYLAIPTELAKEIKSFKLDNLSTAIECIFDTLSTDAPIYNLAGQRVSSDAKGILIQNGKKFFNK